MGEGVGSNRAGTSDEASEVLKGADKRTGDHIDFWDDGVLAGSGSFESFFRITLGAHWDGWFSDHELSKVVLFWEMK